MSRRDPTLVEPNVPIHSWPIFQGFRVLGKCFCIGFGPMAYSPHWPPPASTPGRRSSPGSDARHRSPDVILGEGEYFLSFPVYLCLSLSLPLLLRQSLCTLVNSISLFVLDSSQQRTAGIIVCRLMGSITEVICGFWSSKWLFQCFRIGRLVHSHLLVRHSFGRESVRSSG